MELSPSIMFLNSHSKYTNAGISGESGPISGWGQGDVQDLAMTSHDARGKGDREPPVQVGRDTQFVIVPDGHCWVGWWLGSVGWRRWCMCDYDTCAHNLLHPRAVIKKLKLEIWVYYSSPSATLLPGCWHFQPWRLGSGFWFEVSAQDRVVGGVSQPSAVPLEGCALWQTPAEALLAGPVC